MAEPLTGRVLTPAAPAVPAGSRPRWRVPALLAAAIPVLLLSQGFLLEKLLDLGLEMRLAALWGTSSRRDMYLVASSVLVPSAMMQMIAVPLVVDQRRRGAADAGRTLIGTLTAISFVFMWIMAGIAVAVWWSAGGSAVTPLLEMAAASLSFIAAGFGMTLVSIAAADRIADGRFDLASMRVPLIRAAMLGAAFVLPLGIASPAIGALASAGALTAAIWGRGGLGRSLGRPALAGLFGAAGLFAMNAYPTVPRLLIERPILGAMGDGTLATLDYAEKTTVIFGLAGFAVVGVAATALLGTHWSHRQRALLVALVLTPVAAATAFFAHPIVALLFQRGEFQASDSAAVMELTRLLAPSIPFIAALPLLAPGVREANATGRAVALIAAALLCHTLATAYAHQTGDVRPLVIAFDVAYAVLFVGFFVWAPGSAGKGAPPGPPDQAALSSGA